MISEIKQHPFDPIYDKNARILLLGTFPSQKSRENAFYYGHPQNRFWRLLATLYDEATPEDIRGKTDFLIRHQIALWDVLQSCSLKASADSSIKNAVPNAVASLLENSQISAVFTNGQKAKNLYDRFILPASKIQAIALPSTSPANARFHFERLRESWQIIKDYT